ncbi:MAG TPA: hypothetical protein VGN39_07105 [Terriglobales bacterium]|jgi:hypothetical protein|nr:hypothetical protein [Terriglobales bacterium]
MTHGGKRERAGRPKTQLSRVKAFAPLRKSTAEQILSQHDEEALWNELLTATSVISVAVVSGGNGNEREQITVPDYKIRIDALKYLTNRRDGMPIQAIAGAGADQPNRITVTIMHVGGESSPPDLTPRLLT